MRPAILLCVLLTGCETIGAHTRYTQHHMPDVGDHNVCLRVTLTPSAMESIALCQQEFGVSFFACGEYPRADGGPQRLIAPAPANWNDSLGIFVLGHELLHNLGGRHE